MIQGTIRRVGTLYYVRPNDYPLEYADNVGAVRQGTAFLKRRDTQGVVGSFWELLAGNCMGARCEVAGKILFNPIRWHALAEKIFNLPDLGDFIDVKGRSLFKHELGVDTDALDDFAYLLITAEYAPEYVVHGWLWGREIKQHPEWLDDKAKRGRASYFCPQKELRDTDELIAIVHPDRKQGIA